MVVRPSSKSSNPQLILLKFMNWLYHNHLASSSWASSGAIGFIGSFMVKTCWSNLTQKWKNLRIFLMWSTILKLLRHHHMISWWSKWSRMALTVKMESTRGRWGVIWICLMGLINWIKIRWGRGIVVKFLIFCLIV